MRSAYETLVLGGDRVSVAVSQIQSSADPNRAATEILHHAMSEHTLIRVAGLLEDHGFDLEAIQLEPSAVEASRLPKILPGLDTSAGVAASNLRDALLAHRVMLHDLISALGGRHPGRFVVAYGLGLALSYPAVHDRQSSDLDIFLPTDQSHVEVLRSLVREFGFAVEGVSVGSGAGRALAGWKLAARRDAHNLTIDGFTGGRPSSGHQWIPPFELPQLFERARSIQLASGGMVLVPCPEDYLLMVAEKVQRKGDYSMRRVRDVLTVIESEESIDWAHVRAECRRLHIGLGLGWLLDRVEASRPGSIGDPADARYRLAGWERRFQAVMSGATGASVAGRRRARSMHRRIWVTRYVLTHSTKAAALVEVGSGRYRTTIAGVPESWSATL